jgi:methionyl-tRNA formyltransferase
MNNDKQINVAYFGSSEISASLLQELMQNLHINIKLVITQEDKPFGKKLEITACPVKKTASENNIEVFDFKLKNHVHELIDKISLHNIQLGILFAYGAIIPDILLKSFKYGILNVHPSLLPKYRGASPTAFPFIMGEKTSGVSLMVLNTQLDEGPIIKQVKINISETSSINSRVELEKNIPSISIKQIDETLKDILNNTFSMKNQDHSAATYTRLLKKQDGYIDTKLIKKAIKGELILNKEELPEIIKWYLFKNNILSFEPVLASHVVMNMQKGLSPWPDIWTTFKTPRNEIKRIKIFECSIKDECLIIEALQIEGKNKIKYKDFIKAYSL